MRVRLLAISIVWLLLIAASVAAQTPTAPARAIDDQQAQSNGIRTLTSKHLILVTDVPSSPEIDRLPALFDAAVPIWAEYFGVDLAKTTSWQARGYLIGDRRRFEALGLLPPGSEKFVNGISMGAELWLHDQPTPYYRRHLLLHEGTHVFMASFLGNCGPGWYMEGTAELFGTHRFNEKTGQLTMRIIPGNREEVPMLGRIKLIRDAIADHKLPTLDTVMQSDNSKQMSNEAYAWCWALAKFLDTHPRYRDRFHALYKNVQDPNFNELMRHEFHKDWPELTAEWQAYIATLDHGYDFDRMAIDFRAGAPASSGLSASNPADEPSHVEIVSDRGWQSSGLQLEAGKSYKITASGRYQIAAEKTEVGTQTWPCEPGGVTLEYLDGHPLGMLLSAIYPGTSPAPAAAASFANPAAIGLQTVLKPTTSGTLYLRVNDSAARLDDNSGTLKVSVEKVP